MKCQSAWALDVSSEFASSINFGERWIGGANVKGDNAFPDGDDIQRKRLGRRKGPS
jgi:hypothetical protein